MTRRRRLLLGAAFLVALAGAPTGGACRKKPAPAPGVANERRPYTPIPPPPTRTLRPGEPTPLPNLPG